jgi:RNA polymerase sigma factor (sigma-70 family)
MNESNRSELVLELFDAYYNRVYAFARKSAGPAVAEDVAQEVFVRVLQHPRLESLSISISYLLKIAHNLLRRRYSRSVRLTEILDQHVRPAAERRHAGDTRATPAERGVLDQAIRRLNTDEQEAVRLIVCEGCSYAQAAMSLDVSVTTINNWKHRGIAKLRQHLEEEDEMEMETETPPLKRA